MFFFGKCSTSYVMKSTIYCNNEWYICKLLTKRIWPKGVSADKHFELCDFSFISGFAYQFRSGLERTNVTILMMT
jgi:hypothetical protein